MFHFAGFASLTGYMTIGHVGRPIRTPQDHSSLAAPLGFSQLGTSFFASDSRTIPQPRYVLDLQMSRLFRSITTK